MAPFLRIAITAFVLGFGLPLCGDEDVTTVKLDTARPGRMIPQGFLGFSREWRHFVTPDEGPDAAVHPAYLRLIEQLSRFNKQGVCFRIGGNSADGMGVSPEPARWQQLRVIYQATRMPLIINLNLAREDVELDKAMILDAQRFLPPEAILSFELGNEPDGWAGRYRPKDYTFPQYLPVFGKVGSQLVPGLVHGLAGPAYAHGAPAGPLQEFLAAETGLINLVTVHSYRFDPKSKPAVERLLDERDTAGFAQKMADGIQIAHDARLKIRLTETDSAWGGGIPGFSDSFGASLWTLDVLFEMARVGLDGIHFHGGGLASYTPIREDLDKTTKKAIISARAPYYGMWLFAEAAANEAKLLPVEVQGNARTKVWATLDNEGTTRLVLINKDTASSRSFALQVQATSAAVKRLSAESLAATEGIEFNGQTFSGSVDGNPIGQAQNERIAAVHGSLSVQLAPISAALVTLVK